MKLYKKIYLDYFGYGEQERIMCEVCENEAVDIHHIEPKKMGGSKTKDYIENLIALCRDCHMAAHNNTITKEFLTEIHLSNLI